MKQPLGVILAGGQATRMGGGDKGLLMLGGTTILDHVLQRLTPQVGTIAINANGDTNRFATLDMPVISDSIGGFAGPLSGVLAGLDWAAKQNGDHIITAATDTPFFPHDLAQRLIENAHNGLCLAASPSGRQPTFGLWPVNLKEDLRSALQDGVRKVVQWTRQHDAGTAEFPEDDAFFNVNTPDDLVRAQGML